MTTGSAGGGASLAGMLEESERIFAETGHYGGLDELPLKAAEPIRYEKMFSRLRGGLVGARETAMNISASPIVREVGELCFALYTPEGDAITLSTGIMAHVHTMSMAIKHMIRSDYETNPGIAPGDIFVNNDPQLGGVHNADVMNFLPLFHEGEIVGWAAGVVHELDVGAPQPASHAHRHREPLRGRADPVVHEGGVQRHAQPRLREPHRDRGADAVLLGAR